MPIIDPLATSDWDGLVLAHKHGTVFHTTAWMRVLADAYRHRCHGFIERDEFNHANPDNPRCLMPLIEIDSPLTGRRGVCVPFSDQCGPLLAATTPDPALAVLSPAPSLPLKPNWLCAALDLGTSRNWRYFEWRDQPAPSPSADGSIPAPAWLKFYSHTLPLSADSDALFTRLDSSMRRAVRKAEKTGVQIQFSTEPAALDEYDALHCRTRKKHGLPPQPRRFFDAIQSHIVATGNGLIALAKHQGQTIAGAIYFFSRKHALYKFGASDERFLELRANNLLMWEAIKRFAQQGFTDLNFGRTSIGNDGLRRFKSSWGAEETTIAYHRYDFRVNRYVEGRDDTEGLHTRLFRLMPVPMLRLAGNLLYPHMS